MAAQLKTARGYLSSCLVGGSAGHPHMQAAAYALGCHTTAAWLQGIVASFEGSTGQWEAWYRSKQPESAELPGEWETKCSELQRMILVRCIRCARALHSERGQQSDAKMVEATAWSAPLPALFEQSSGQQCCRPDLHGQMLTASPRLLQP